MRTLLRSVAKRTIDQFRGREDWVAGNGCAGLGIGCRRGSGAGTAGAPIGAPNGAPRLVGGGAGGGRPGSPSIGPSLITAPPCPGMPPSHSHGQPRRECRPIRCQNEPRVLQGSVAHPTASRTAGSIAQIANRNRFMCGPLIGIIPERERRTGVARIRREVALVCPRTNYAPGRAAGQIGKGHEKRPMRETSWAWQASLDLSIRHAQTELSRPSWSSRRRPA